MKKHMTVLASILLLTSQLYALTGYNEIKGTTSTIAVKNNDGLVDFGLIIPGMDFEQIINFDLGKVISPVNDQIKVAGRVIDLPSNLSLPQQTEKYFISINLSKPEFRAFVEDDGVYNMYALYGKFPLKEMVKGFQDGKSIFELVEFFEFISGGTKTVPVKGDVSGLTVPIDTWSFSDSYTVKAPTYANDKVVISFALLKEKNLFFPTDMKKVVSGKTQNLAKKPASEYWNLALLMNAAKRSFSETFDGDLLSGVFGSYSVDRATSPLAQVSYTMTKASATTSPAFLPMVNAPTFDSTKLAVKATAPKTISGVVAYATTLTLSEVSTGGSPNFPIDFKKTLWTTEEMGWSQNFQIPSEVKKLIQSGKEYSWDIAYLGTGKAETDTQIDWEKVSHVTRNSLKF